MEKFKKFPCATAFELDVINTVNKVIREKKLSVFSVAKSMNYTNTKNLKSILAHEKSCTIATLQKFIDFIDLQNDCND
jgi:hypothetical protein